MIKHLDNGTQRLSLIPMKNTMKKSTLLGHPQSSLLRVFVRMKMSPAFQDCQDLHVFTLLSLTSSSGLCPDYVPSFALLRQTWSSGLCTSRVQQRSNQQILGILRKLSTVKLWAAYLATYQCFRHSGIQWQLLVSSPTSPFALGSSNPEVAAALLGPTS